MARNNLIDERGVLSAYDEYTEEVQVQQEKKEFQPVNHLGSELSPYLLAHAKNPVGWYSWCQEAFDVAISEDRPIFLSIGYSSEHWCHVMNRDCFNDVETAGMINSICIPVKVDKEERPDLDNLFMEICRVQNGSAGWPLNIFLMPDGRPFFCTTWLPKRTIGRMPGLTELMPRIRWLWTKQRDDVERSASELDESVKARFNLLAGRSGGRIGKIKAFEALNDLRRIFNLTWGGFGAGSKWPEPVKLIFLLKLAEENSGASKRDKLDALTMVDITLRRMWRGGIHDHLGGGFSRYAIDERWLVPHFEKLLCDQAMILLTVSKAQALVPNSFHRLMAEDIIFCLTRYFTDNASFSQGFKSAIDGDTDDGEGRYYLWTEDEIKAILPEEDFGLFCAAYAVLPSGNFGNELAGSQMGCNILYEASTVKELAKRYGLKGSEIGARLHKCRNLLLEARDKRYVLKSDNKILMSWNGLIIGALARASVSFEVSEWRDFAERTALFINKTFPDKNNNNSWHRSWIDGHAMIDAVCEDYAYLLWGIIELYKAAKHFNAGEKQLSDWLKVAQNLADILIAKFYDEKVGGLFLMKENEPNVNIRMKSPEDINSLPSPNSLAVIALNELAIILEEKKYSDYARKIINCFSRYALDNPMSCLSMICADLIYKPVKNKPAPAPVSAPVLSDEELNKPEPNSQPENPEGQSEKSPETRRASRRTSRTNEHSARPERRTRRTRT